ncbi:hypothetical protein QR680_011987 [Steinernema hermaphroditum]|uniref:Uncharacterized protein n=1 Tax=Steinernema hermaphroditum TaxID=289476 RepID=A0AA39LZY9_9BILA|nr:hypothetical protein QR680_011987 [Steinernema hermaphroditum]
MNFISNFCSFQSLNGLSDGCRFIPELLLQFTVCTHLIPLLSLEKNAMVITGIWRKGLRGLGPQVVVEMGLVPA